MEEFAVKQIGCIRVDDNGMCIALKEEFRPGLAGLSGFGHLQVLWWFSGCDNPQCRSQMQEASPYRRAPEILGVFATRSPHRPNPLALSCVEVTGLDADTGTIGIAWIDAEDGTPVLDLKPYTPSLDRVESPRVPDWCAHWPVSLETSGDFDWSEEFRV